MDRTDALLADWHGRAQALQAEVAKAVVGQQRAIALICTAVFARGHVLLQGDVGVGKTTLLRAFAQVLGGGYSRVEGTVDLMPNDLVYHTFIDEAGRPAVQPGPLIEHGPALAIFFFNEINRARPQVHALLLRAMAERSVRAFDRDHHLPHLQVFADRNRVEREETFEIAAAARDRFMMEITIEAPATDAERRALIFDPRFHDTDALVAALQPAMVPYQELESAAAAIQRGVTAAPALQDYALALWSASTDPQRHGVRLSGIDVGTLMLSGAGPRGMSLLMRAARVAAWLAGRSHVTPEDLQSVLAETLAHRLCFQPVHELHRHEIAPALVQGIVAAVAAP